MAIPSSSPSKAKPVSKKRPPSGDNGGQPQPKRIKSPGVRLIHGRIYDSDNGKTCHQCRQKTMDFVASCKNLKGNKFCKLNMCHKCLLNRYGEKAEEVGLLDDWVCPKCRGICNCSFCMKKMGHQPTGILIRAAKACGHSSVSEFIDKKGVNNLEMYKVAASPKKLLSPKKPARLNKETRVVSPSEPGKENSFDASNDASLNNTNATIVTIGKKSKKSKREGLKEINNGACPENSPKRPKVFENGLKMNDDALSGKKNSKKAVLDKVSRSPIKPVNKMKKKDRAQSQEAVVIKPSKDDNAPAKVTAKPQKVKKCGTSLDQVAIDIPLPKGSVLTTVWGIELSHEDIGNALQFLEFCATFGKVFDVKKTQGHSILRELQRGCCGRRGQYSSAIRFHIQLLSFIQEDMGEESPGLSRNNSWLQALEKCISESVCVPKELSLSALGGAVEKYDGLAFSRKLRILNFLCDEALSTEKLRNWIDDEISKIADKEKESRDKIAATKNKEKLLKQKLQDDIAQAIIAKNGAPLTISEHEDIVLQIKREVAQVQDEIVRAKSHINKRKQIPVAVRSEPCLLDTEGRVFWKLGCCGGENDILLQDMGSWDAEPVAEKWFIYGTEQKQEIDKYISSIRIKRSRNQKAFPVLSCADSSNYE